MTVETSGTLTTPKHARIMHDGVALAYTVDDGNTTAVSGSTYAKNNVLNGLTSDKYQPNATSWTLEIDLTGGSQAVTGVCIGSPDLFTSGQTITLQRENSGFVTVDTSTPTDDSPLMFLFDSVSSATWRITGTGSAAPTIYNVMIGNPLVMEQPFYGGYAPARMNRKTQLIGNISDSGELLGRSVRRSILAGDYNWEHLTYDWVKSNLRGPSGLIQSLEAGTGYIAWRPYDEDDCDYIMRATINAPTTMGVKNYSTFGMSAEVYSYE